MAVDQLTTYTCRACDHSAPWTDGQSTAAGDPVDEFWCQKCGEEQPLPKPDDPFGTTCLDCGKPIDDTQPYANTDDGNLLHLECGEPCVCHTAFTCLAHESDD